MSGFEIRRHMRKEMRTNNYRDSEFTDRVTTRYRNYRRTQQRRKLREEISSLSGKEPREYLLHLRKETGDSNLILNNQEILRKLRTNQNV